jgi:CubicO group peptidase (beta-lactamase class C family)
MNLRLALTFVLLTSARAAAESPAGPWKEALAVVEQAVARDEIRGAVVLVTHNGRVVLHQAVGWRDRDGRVPMTRDTLFHVASDTKPVVATAVLMLAEEGKIDLDAEVRRYLPSFDNDKSKSITVKQLLSHTSGFHEPTYFLRPLLQKSPEHPNAPSLRDEVNRFGAMGPAAPPGTSFFYSNVNFNALGALVEAVSGRPLDDFLRARIYQPLGMADAAHRDTPDRVSRRSMIFRKDGDGWRVTYKPGDPPQFPFVRGAGGLVTTASDYARFLQLYVDRGRFNGRQLLKPDSVAAATAPVSNYVYTPEQQAKRTYYYGLGWHVDNDGTFSHGGSDGTFVWVDPSRELTGILFTQCPGPGVPRGEFVRRVRQAVDLPN